MPSFLAAVVFAVAATRPVPARAEPDAASLLVLDGVIGVSRFTQGSGAPPLCCRERESWSSSGPVLALGGGYRVLPWLEPGLDLSVASLSGSDTDASGRRLEVSMAVFGAAPRVGFVLSSRSLYFVPRVGWRFERVSGEFTDRDQSGSRRTSEEQFLTGPGIGLAVGYRVAPSFGVGLDLEGTWLGVAGSTDLRLGLSATWAP